MQAHTHERVVTQGANKRRIGLLVGIFNDMVEVSHRLVGMDHESERDFTQLAASLCNQGKCPGRKQNGGSACSGGAEFYSDLISQNHLRAPAPETSGPEGVGCWIDCRT